MDTAGTLLRNKRLKLKLTFTQVSSMTKIPVAALKAIEKNQYQKLQDPAYIKGFIQNYAQTVGLNPQKTVAVFRRDYDKVMEKKIIPAGFTQPLNSSWVSRISQNLTLMILAFFVGAGYLGLSIYKLYQPPPLEILEPQQAQEVTEPVLIKGKTNHDAVVTLNGKTINLEPDGSFTTIYQNGAGTTVLNFKATSRRQKSTQVTRHVIIVE